MSLHLRVCALSQVIFCDSQHHDWSAYTHSLYPCLTYCFTYSMSYFFRSIWSLLSVSCLLLRFDSISISLNTLYAVTLCYLSHSSDIWSSWVVKSTTWCSCWFLSRVVSACIWPFGGFCEADLLREHPHRRKMTFFSLEQICWLLPLLRTSWSESCSAVSLWAHLIVQSMGLSRPEDWSG